MHASFRPTITFYRFLLSSRGTTCHSNQNNMRPPHACGPNVQSGTLLTIASGCSQRQAGIDRLTIISAYIREMRRLHIFQTLVPYYSAQVFISSVITRNTIQSP